MRRPQIAAIIYLAASPIAFADFDSDDKEQPTAMDVPPPVSLRLNEGDVVPATTDLIAIPPADSDGYASYAGYRYAEFGRHAAIVDPRTRTIIGVLR
jgi:hypothetical protein